MLTPAERNSLSLTLGFLLLGAGIKVWKKWRVEIGPFEPALPAASAPQDSSEAASHHPAVPAADSSQPSPADARSRPFPDPLPAGFRKPARHAGSKPPKPKTACPVDLNAATEGGLAELPGVGPRTAAAISAHRKAQGPFRDIRELLEVKGIGEKKLALIAPCLVLSGTGTDPLPASASVDPEAVGEADPASP